MVDVSNLDSPRSLVGSVSFKSISTQEPSCLSLEDEIYYYYNGEPSITFGVEPSSTAPILHVPYGQRTYNYGTVTGSASYPVFRTS